MHHPKQSQAPGPAAFRIDADEIRRGLELVLQPGQLTELRAVDCRVAGEWKTGTYSGFFTREAIDDLIAAVDRIQSAEACYFVPNPINPALHARAYNRARITGKESGATTDNDIIFRRWLLIDVDATRPSKISATELERAATEELAVAIDNWLWEHGFPPGIIGDSGNGTHLMVPLRPTLPADDGGRIERLLKMLAAEFNTDKATVDTSVFNPARIWKLPGSLVCKGDHAPEIGREWRMSRIIQVCKECADAPSL